MIHYAHHHAAVRHLQGLATVAIPNFDNVAVRVAEAAVNREVVAVLGPAGVGKSYAVGSAVENVQRHHSEVRVTWLDLSEKVRGKALLEMLYGQVSHLKIPRYANVLTLRDAIHQVLRESQNLLVVDEAHNIGPQAFDELRWLLNRPDLHIGLAMAGLDTLGGIIPTDMRSRVTSVVHMTYLSDDIVVDVLCAIHPLFRTANPATLTTVNRIDLGGELRNWIKFLARAHRYSQAAQSQLTDDVITHTLADTKW